MELSKFLKLLRPGTVYIDMNYLKDRVGSLTQEQITEKCFKVQEWMDRNLDNEWVQDAGKNIINRLNAMYTQEQATIH
jgi:hypothetical protein